MLYIISYIYMLDGNECEKINQEQTKLINKYLPGQIHGAVYYHESILFSF